MALPPTWRTRRLRRVGARRLGGFEALFRVSVAWTCGCLYLSVVCLHCYVLVVFTYRGLQKQERIKAVCYHTKGYHGLEKEPHHVAC